jgi:hypothetical protein
MSTYKQISSVSRREFLVGASCVVASGRLVIGKPHGTDRGVTRPSASAPVTHEIWINVTPGQNEPKYTYPNGDDASLAYAQQGDMVFWRAKTGHTKHHLAVIFVGDTPFQAGTDSVWGFHGDDSDEGNGTGLKASIKSTVSDGDQFEYYVGIWDEHDSTKTGTWSDDPTIMIGKGGPNGDVKAAISKLAAANHLLKRAAAAYPLESDDIKGIESQLSQLIQKLKHSSRKASN